MKLIKWKLFLSCWDVAERNRDDAVSSSSVLQLFCTFRECLLTHHFSRLCNHDKWSDMKMSKSVFRFFQLFVCLFFGNFSMQRSINRGLLKGFVFLCQLQTITVQCVYERQFVWQLLIGVPPFLPSTNRLRLHEHDLLDAAGENSGLGVHWEQKLYVCEKCPSQILLQNLAVSER